MRLSSDLNLYYSLWEKADDLLVHQHKLFGRLIDVFLIACAIGIKDDKQITSDEIEFPLNQPRSIGRNTYQSALNTDLSDCLDLMLENAIVTSKNINFDQEERLKLAFNPDYENKKFSPASFLIAFANYGIKQILDNVNLELPSITIADDLYKYLNSLDDADYDELLAGITLDELI